MLPKRSGISRQLWERARVRREVMFVEGLVPIDTLPGDRYIFQENVRRIVGQRTRREFAIGGRVHVSLDRVDPLDRKLQFSIMDRKPRKSPAGHRGK